jgi:hypothetical protein
MEVDESDIFLDYINQGYSAHRSAEMFLLSVSTYTDFGISIYREDWRQFVGYIRSRGPECDVLADLLTFHLKRARQTISAIADLLHNEAEE